MHTVYGRLFLTTMFVFVLTALGFYLFALDRAIQAHPESPVAQMIQSLGPVTPRTGTATVSNSHSF